MFMLEMLLTTCCIVFEGDELNNKATAAVEKRIHGDAINPTISQEDKRPNV